MTDPFDQLRLPDGRSDPSAAYRQRLAREIRQALANDSLTRSPADGPTISISGDDREPIAMEVPMDIPAHNTRRRHVRALAAVAAALVAAAIALGLARGGLDRNIDTVDSTPTTIARATSSTGPGPSTSQPASTALAALPDVTGFGDATEIFPGGYTTGEVGTFMTSGDGALYVTNVEGGVGRYDLENGALLGTTQFPIDSCTRPEYGFGSLWTVRCNSNVLYRIDGASGVVQASITLPFQFIGDSRTTTITATGNDLWVLSDPTAGIAVRVDPITNEVAGTVAVPKNTDSIRAGFDSLWTTQQATVTRLDPVSGSIVATIGAEAQFLAVGPDSVWALDGTSAVVHRIDPDSNTVVADIRVSPNGMSLISYADIEADADTVWVQMAGIALSAIDPAANSVIARYDSYDHGGVAVTADGAWIGETFIKRIVRLPRP